jgi:hypothetical protein
MGERVVTEVATVKQVDTSVRTKLQQKDMDHHVKINLADVLCTGSDEENRSFAKGRGKGSHQICGIATIAHPPESLVKCACGGIERKLWADEEIEEQWETLSDKSFVGTEDGFGLGAPTPSKKVSTTEPADKTTYNSLEAHEAGKCRPCSDIMRRGKCRKGNDCNYCHRHPYRGHGIKFRTNSGQSEQLRNNKTKLEPKAQMVGPTEPGGAGAGAGAWPTTQKSGFPTTTQKSGSELQGRQVWVPEEARGRVLGNIKQWKRDETGVEWCLISTSIMPDFWVPLIVARGMLIGELVVKPSSQPQPVGTQAPYMHPQCVSCLEPFTSHESRVLFSPCNHACIHSDCYGSWRAQNPEAAASCFVCRSPVAAYTHV